MAEWQASGPPSKQFSQGRGFRLPLAIGTSDGAVLDDATEAVRALVEAHPVATQRELRSIVQGALGPHA